MTARERGAVKKRMFEELLGSVREAGAIPRGQRKPSRRISIRASGARDGSDSLSLKRQK